MEALIENIFQQIKDYRANEDVIDVNMTKARIRKWILQFEADDRVFLLEELKHIFTERYCSISECRHFLNLLVARLTKDLKYNSVKEFLQNTIFLDLQPARKSQKVMLKLLAEFLLEEHNFNIKSCGSVAKKHFVYIDDILCTGNTLIRDIKEWCSELYIKGKTNLEAIKDKSSELIFVYIFIHQKNYQKKKVEMRYNIDAFLENGHKMYQYRSIQNDEKSVASSLNLILPIETEEDKIVEYKDKIIAQVDTYTEEKGYKDSPEEFYRNSDRPKQEKLFTNAENRNRFENIILLKGIDILSHAHTNIDNMRALGYCLPSQKSFGFGTLCFTWRNIANNTPLVFWYSGGHFFPLFVKNQTNVH